REFSIARYGSFFSSRRRHTRLVSDWSSDVCSSDLKSRILRALTTLLDPHLPFLAGCEIHDNPYAPICARCRELIAKCGEATAIAYLTPEGRYVEKLATPDVTIADLIGDIDPIKAARGGHELSSELTVHYGLLP